MMNHENNDYSLDYFYYHARSISDRIDSYSIFSIFKRHFNKTKKRFKEFRNNGFPSLNIKAGKTFDIYFEKFNEPEINIFVVLLRRFIDRSGILYYEKIWNIFKEDFSSLIKEDRIVFIDKLIYDLPNGGSGFVLNSNKISSEKSYNIIYNAFFFKEKGSTSILQDQLEHPIVNHMLWLGFVQYNLDLYNIVSHIFDIYLEIRYKELFKKIYPEKSSKKPKCIYCLRVDGGFTSEEHIFPESLGNEELVLPKGYVCDRCNHNTLSMLDNKLINFFPIASRKVLHSNYTKDGKFQKYETKEFSIEKLRPTHLRYIDKTGKGYSENITLKSYISSDELLLVCRSIFKILLGMVCLGDTEKIYDKKFDKVRKFILRGGKMPNSILMYASRSSSAYSSAGYNPIEKDIPGFICIYGIAFLLSLESKPRITLNEELLNMGFLIFRLHKNKVSLSRKVVLPHKNKISLSRKV
jgi:hypothetical protein